MIRAAVVIALLSLASCDKPIRCDAHGMVIIPADATVDQQLDLNRRNIDFINRRADAQIGRGGHYTAEALDKATGCP